MSAGSYLSKIFGASPIRPLQDHMARVLECAEALPPFMEAAQAGDWERAGKQRKELTRLENEADDLKKDIRMHLPSTLFMPVSRSDVLDLLTVQDRVANKAKDVAGLVLGRQMNLPAAIADDYNRFLQRNLDAVRQAHRTVRELNDLMESGFGPAEIEAILRLIDELDDIERDTDELQVPLRSSLFAIEKDLPPIDAMFLYRVIDWTGDIADMAQRVGSRLQLLIAR